MKNYNIYNFHHPQNIISLALVRFEFSKPFFFIILKKKIPIHISIFTTRRSRQIFPPCHFPAPISFTPQRISFCLLAGYNIRAFFIYHDTEAPSLSTRSDGDWCTKEGAALSTPADERNKSSIVTPSLRLIYSSIFFPL